MLFIETFLIYCLPVAALLVITTSSPVISVLALILFTTFLACILFLQGFSFVSLLYVVVYVGAVAILFLFVIIIINVRDSEIIHTGKSYTNFFPITFSVATLAFVTFYSTVPTHTVMSNNTITMQSTLGPGYTHLFAFSDIQAFADAFYGYSAFHFLLVSLLLLTAIIGPIALCIHTHPSH